MLLSDYDFSLPERLIAQTPLTPRDSSRLMVLNRQKTENEHTVFRNIVEYLEQGDVLVINNTKVLPARLFGTKEATGARIEVLLLSRKDIDTWEVLVKPGKKARIGTKLDFGEDMLTGEIIEETDAGGRIIKFCYSGIFEQLLDKLGTMPLPPYITEKLSQPERYQTVYAVEQGSAAAPTAGLHFTPELLKAIGAKGVEIVEILLHVGLGTFRPVKAENILEHQMHSEYFRISESAAAAINKAKDEGRRIIAVGTTTARTLEGAARTEGRLVPGDGWTDIYIYPGYEFKLVNALVTNFHFPKSTLLMLVSALAGRERVLEAYTEAMSLDYRFYSFGDAMLIL